MTPGTDGPPPYLELAWQDPAGPARGWLVVDTVRRGVASGGLRMRPGCTVDEVRQLARAMSVKEALVARPEDRYQPFGGAKGGIDADPRAPGARGVLERYLVAVLPLVRSVWALGADLGVRQADLDELAAGLGLRSTVDAALPFVPDGAPAGLRRLAAAFAVRVGGVGLDDLVGGYGVARAAVTALDLIGRDPATATATVQGFGTMGGGTARYLAEAGIRVVAVADELGVVHHPGGVDVERLLARRSRSGLLDRSALPPGHELLPGAAWLSVPADVLVPAAGSHAVHRDNAADVAAAVVVEAANVPLTAAADAALHRRGVLVVPDVVANCAANSWWWWTLFGDVPPTAAGAFERIARTIPDLVRQVAADTGRVGPRAAARAAADRALARPAPRYGHGAVPEPEPAR